jgi:hypothetical protein
MGEHPGFFMNNPEFVTRPSFVLRQDGFELSGKNPLQKYKKYLRLSKLIILPRHSMFYPQRCISRVRGDR